MRWISSQGDMHGPERVLGYPVLVSASNCRGPTIARETPAAERRAPASVIPVIPAMIMSPHAESNQQGDQKHH
jgi:hypothetical protein